MSEQLKPCPTSHADDVMFERVEELIAALKPHSDGSGPGFNQTFTLRRGYIPCLVKELELLKAQVKSLAKFKSYVHRRLDEAGIPADPESPHKAEGCRIGGRLDIALNRETPGEKLAEAYELHLNASEKLSPLFAVGAPEISDEQLNPILEESDAAYGALQNALSAYRASRAPAKGVA